MGGAIMDDPQPTAAGRHYEQLGFTFCKLGTICLIALAPAYALLGAAALAIFFYVRALQHGVSRSDCILRHPLVIIAFWLAVTAADIVWLVARSGLMAAVGAK